MRKFLKLAAVTALSAGALAFSTGSAAAHIVCNDDGDCWHVADTYTYPTGFGIAVHDDSWKWDNDQRYRWREHEGRGYWHSGLWVTF